jgi:DNA polymerase I/DNA polymerase-2
VKARCFILDAGYSEIDGRTYNFLLVKMESGEKSVIIDPEPLPYFYIDFNKDDEVIKKLESTGLLFSHELVEKNLPLERKKFIRAYALKPSELPKLRDAIKHQPIINECYEYNLNHYKRYLRDRGISPATWIEVDLEKFDGLLPEAPEARVYLMKEAVSLKDIALPEFSIASFDIEYVDGEIVLISFAFSEESVSVYGLKGASGADEEFESEKDLLNAFFARLREFGPDILVGYNSDGFDFDIIKERTKLYKLKAAVSDLNGSVKWVKRGRGYSAKIDGIVHLDLFQFVQNILSPQLQSEVLTLNEVAMEIVGEGKEDLGYEKIVMLWRDGPQEELVEYSRNDALITYRLGKALLPQIFALSAISGETPFDACRETFGLLVDNYLVKKTREFDLIAPNLPKQDEIAERRKAEPYAGGYVIEPAAGLHKNIAVFDFRSLYPSIIVSFNISPETLNCACCGEKGEGIKVPELDYWFCSKRKGFVSACVEEVLSRRFELKNKLKALAVDDPEYRYTSEMQGALKVLANSSYGYLAYAGARWYSRECAESCAAFGRFFIKQAVNEAQKYGEVIYGDTDSLFVKIDSEEKAYQFLEEINRSLPGIMELELQGIYEKGIFSYTREGRAAKKRYALLGKDGKLLVRGFEAVRKDWCELAKRLQKEVLKETLKGKVDNAVLLVRKVISDLRSRSIDVRELSMVAQLGKELHEYKVKTPHAVAAKKLMDRGYDLSRGEQIRFVIVKGEGSIADRAEPLEFASEKDYDIDYYLEHQIYPAALRVLEPIGYSRRDIDLMLREEGTQQSLF